MNKQIEQTQLYSNKAFPKGFGVQSYFIVTGATGSIGVEIVKILLQKGFSVIMTCRNLQKGNAVRNSILKEFDCGEKCLLLEELDLASLVSIQTFAGKIERKNITLIGLMNNAGTINRRFSLTEDGFENTVGVNYIGIFLFTKLLIPLLADGAAIVNVVSMAAKSDKVKKDFFDFTPENFTQLGNYARSKSALMLFTALLAEKMERKLIVNAADPGIVDTGMITLHRWFDFLTDMLFRPLIRTPKKGAVPLLNAILSKQSGQLFIGNRSKPISGKFIRHPLKKWLWEKTEQIITKKLQQNK